MLCHIPGRSVVFQWEVVLEVRKWRRDEVLGAGVVVVLVVLVVFEEERAIGPYFNSIKCDSKKQI